MSKTGKEEFAKKVKEEYAELRERNANKKAIVLKPIEKARESGFKIDWNDGDVYTPAFQGVKVFDDYSIADIRKFIDWTFFFQAWNLTGNYDGIESVATADEEAQWLEKYKTEQAKEKAKEALKLWRDSQAMLTNIERDNMLTAKAVFGIFPANTEGDDVIVYTDESRTVEKTRFHQIREQQDKQGKEAFHSLADFVAPVESGVNDYIWRICCYCWYWY